jgi:hypothetical protein
MKTSDFNQVKCIKNEPDRLLVKDGGDQEQMERILRQAIQRE